MDPSTTEQLLLRIYQLYIKENIRNADVLLPQLEQEFPGVTPERIIAVTTHLIATMVQGITIDPDAKPENLLQGLQGLPMPNYDKPDPSEFEIQRITKYLGEGRFSELNREHQSWVCYRLMPSLSRYGVYPPPALN